MKRTVYTPAVVERIRGLLGRMRARDIAAAVGVSLPSLKSWARDKKISLAPPISKTLVAQYNRLRQRAHQLGLRLSAQNGRVSLWVSVVEDLTFAEAAQYLKHANRRARFAAVESAYERGTGQLNGTIAPPVAPLAKMKGRRPKRETPPPLPADIRIVFAQSPRLSASIEMPQLNCSLSLPTIITSREVILAEG